MEKTDIPYKKLFDQGQMMPVLSYNIHKLNFPDWAKSVFKIDQLEKIHELPDPAAFKNYVERLYYRTNQLKDKVAAIYPMLMELKKETIEPLLGEIERFQFPPSIRCHLSGAGTASAFHKDGEEKYGISKNVLNLWIPLTRVSGNNSIYIEDHMDSGNFHPVQLNPGELLVFDAFHLQHGSYPNDTSISRVSLDIRVVPKDISIARSLGFYAI